MDGSDMRPCSIDSSAVQKEQSTQTEGAKQSPRGDYQAVEQTVLVVVVVVEVTVLQ